MIHLAVETVVIPEADINIRIDFISKIIYGKLST